MAQRRLEGKDGSQRATRNSQRTPGFTRERDIEEPEDSPGFTGTGLTETGNTGPEPK